MGITITMITELRPVEFPLLCHPRQTIVMLNHVIQFALTTTDWSSSAERSRCLVAGSLVTATLPIDVLPNLTRPRVVIVTECEGLSA